GNITIQVVTPVTLQPATLPNGTAGQNYSVTFTGSGGTPPYTFFAPFGQLPAGLTLDPQTGVLAGKLNPSGTYFFGIEVYDSSFNRQRAQHTYTITVGPPVITPTGLPNATLNQPYNTTLTVVGATGAVTWSLLSGSMPGLTLNANGTITGTP